eukprot:4501111-Prymnesium_polylepis.1
MRGHEKSTERIEREEQDERLSRLPDARRNVALHLVAPTWADRAHLLGVLSYEQACGGGYGEAALGTRSGEEERRGVLQPCAALGLAKAPTIRLPLGVAVGGVEGEGAAAICQQLGDLGTIAVCDDLTPLDEHRRHRQMGTAGLVAVQ